MAKPKHKKITIFDDVEIWCRNPDETQMIAVLIDEYFDHGIEIKPGDTIFDVGANVGVFALAAYKRANRDLRVFAFEPIPPIFEVLSLNAKDHAPEDFKLFKCGLSNENTTAEFTYYPNMTIWSSAHRDESTMGDDMERNLRVVEQAIAEGHALKALRIVPSGLRRWLIKSGMRGVFKMEKFTCTLRTLSSVIEEHDVQSIDLLKIDAEKSELGILQGVDDAHWARIRQVVLEVDDFKATSATVIAFLEQHGFASIKVDQNDIQREGDFGMMYAKR